MGQAEAEAGDPPAEAAADVDLTEPEESPTDLDEAPSEPEPEPQPEPEPEPDPSPGEPGIDGTTVLARLDELLTAVSRVDDRIAERDRLAARDRDLVDRLHAENQRLRAGEAFAVIAPVARDLVRLRDQLLQLAAAAPEPSTSDAALIEPQLLGILARLGVEPYAPAEGEDFDAVVHQGVGRTKTTDAGLDGKVAAVRREGFTAPDGRPLRAAEVDVFQHVPTDPYDDEDPDDPEPGGT